MNVGVILAAGKGTRLHSVEKNKTSLEVGGKPLVAFGVEVFAATLDKTLVVIGAFPESVQAALQAYDVEYAWQQTPQGTGHAVQVAVERIQELGWSPKTLCVGYGDHMMFYSPESIRRLLSLHTDQTAAVTLVTTRHSDPSSLAWGRITRDGEKITGIVEQKDATPEELSIQEVNAGLYAFDFSFLAAALQEIQPSPVTNELYLTDVIALACQQSRHVASLEVPFAEVGTGVNTQDQLRDTDGVLRSQT